MTITVNGNDAEPGCYIAGHHGQYGLDMLADVVEQFGYDLEYDRQADPRYWRRAAEAESAEDAAVVRNAVGIGSHIARPDECWERHVEAADKLEEWLNEHTVGGSWTWEDGEFYLLDDRMMVCDACQRVGTRDDLCVMGEECPDEDCDGTMQELPPTSIAGVIFVRVEPGETYDDAWRLLCDWGASAAVTDYDALEKGERAYRFRIAIHYEP